MSRVCARGRVCTALGHLDAANSLDSRRGPGHSLERPLLCVSAGRCGMGIRFNCHASACASKHIPSLFRLRPGPSLFLSPPLCTRAFTLYNNWKPHRVRAAASTCAVIPLMYRVEPMEFPNFGKYEFREVVSKSRSVIFNFQYRTR